MQGVYHQQPQQPVNTYHQQPVAYNNPQQVHLVQPNVKVSKVLQYQICCCCSFGEASTLGFVKAYFGGQKFIFFMSILLHALLAFAYNNPAAFITNGKGTGDSELDKTKFTSQVSEHIILAAANLIGLIFAFYPNMANHSSSSINVTQIFCLIFNVIHFIFLIKFMIFMILVGFVGLIVALFTGMNLVLLLVCVFYIVAIVLLGVTIGQFVAQCDMFSAVQMTREDEAQKGINNNNISVNYN